MTGKVTEYPIPTFGSVPYGIAAGPDGFLWFTEVTGNNIGRLDPSNGKILEFAVPTSAANPYAIAVGPDGNLWFTEYLSQKIGVLSTTGLFLNEFKLPAGLATPTGIRPGQDGAMWFVEKDRNVLGRISLSRLIDEFPIQPDNSQPFDLVAAQDGTIWFTGNKAGVVLRAALTSGPAVVSVHTAGAGTNISQNGWIEIRGYHLVSPTTPAAGVIWNTAPSFAQGLMPTQLGDISVTVNGKPAFIYYYCSAATNPACTFDQINVLTPLDSTLGTVSIVVSRGSSSVVPFGAVMKTAVPSLLLFSPKGYVASTHLDGSLLGPTSLYPGASTPAKAGEHIVVYAVGFGLPSTTLVNGSASQSGTLPTLPACQVGGANAVLEFAGLISPGLYQLNLDIPATLTPGDKSVVCSYNATATPSGDLISIQ